jgi:hypothetical protein
MSAPIVTVSSRIYKSKTGYPRKLKKSIDKEPMSCVSDPTGIVAHKDHLLAIYNAGMASGRAVVDGIGAGHVSNCH